LKKIPLVNNLPFDKNNHLKNQSFTFCTSVLTVKRPISIHEL